MPGTPPKPLRPRGAVFPSAKIYAPEMCALLARARVGGDRQAHEHAVAFQLAAAVPSEPQRREIEAQQQHGKADITARPRRATATRTGMHGLATSTPK
jgi:hypothetical protein